MTKQPPDDDNELPLLAYARGSDPETSHEAAESLTPDDVADKERKVLWAIAAGRERGATWDDCERRLAGRMELRQSISPRFKPLRRKGLIEMRFDANGETIKRPGPSNRSQTVWFVTPAGLALLRVIGYLKP